MKGEIKIMENNNNTPIANAGQMVPDESISNLTNFVNEMKAEIELQDFEEKQRPEPLVSPVGDSVHSSVSHDLQYPSSDEESKDETVAEVQSDIKPTRQQRKTVDLASITVKVPKDKKDYLMLRKKRLEAQATYQVVLPKSGYYAEMLKLSSIEIQNLALASQTNSRYNYRQKLLRLVYDKIKNTSLGKVSFIDFLHITAESELNILLYGIYCMTYKNINEYDITCENCEKKYNLSINNKDLLILEVNQDADTIANIRNIITEAKTPKELTSQSFVSNISRLPMNNGCIYEIKEPSLYDSLDRLYKNIDEEKFKDDIGLGFVRFIDSVLIPDDDGEFIRVNDFDTVYVEFNALGDEDYYTLSECVKEISENNRVRFGLKNIVCPHCHHKTEDQIIDDMEYLVFLQHQSQMEKFRTKGTGSN